MPIQSNVRTLDRLLAENYITYNKDTREWSKRDNIYSADRIIGVMDSNPRLHRLSDEDRLQVLKDLESDKSAPPKDVDKAPYDDTALRSALNEALKIRKLEYDDDNDTFVRLISPAVRVPVPLSDIQSEMEYLANLMAYNGVERRVPADLLTQMIQDDARLARVNLLATIIEETAYVPDDDFRLSYLTAWHKLLQINQPLDVTVCVLSHFHWLVKTRMFGLYKPQAHPLMLGIWGNQGIGKSSIDDGHWRTFLHKYYVPDYTLERLADDRNKPLLGSSFVLNLAELVTNNRADHNAAVTGSNLALLKSLLTQSEITYRPMQTTNSVTLKVNASVIYSANTHIFDIIQDQTGMRRFLELTSDAPANKHVSVDHPQEWAYVMDPDNFKRFFCSLDESLDQGYMHEDCTSWPAIKEIQASYIHKTDFQHFLLRNYELDTTIKPTDGLLTKDILSAYKSYAEVEQLDMRFAPGPRSALAQAETLWGSSVRARLPNDGGDSRWVLLLRRTTTDTAPRVWTPGLGAPKVAPQPLTTALSDFMDARPVPQPPQKTLEQAKDLNISAFGSTFGGAN